jgi:hypothetical protein
MAAAADGTWVQRLCVVLPHISRQVAPKMAARRATETAGLAAFSVLFTP